MPTAMFLPSFASNRVASVCWVPNLLAAEWFVRVHLTMRGLNGVGGVVNGPVKAIARE